MQRKHDPRTQWKCSELALEARGEDVACKRCPRRGTGEQQSFTESDGLGPICGITLRLEARRVAGIGILVRDRLGRPARCGVCRVLFLLARSTSSVCVVFMRLEGKVVEDGLCSGKQCAGSSSFMSNVEAEDVCTVRGMREEAIREASFEWGEAQCTSTAVS